MPAGLLLLPALHRGSVRHHCQNGNSGLLPGKRVLCVEGQCGDVGMVIRAHCRQCLICRNSPSQDASLKRRKERRLRKREQGEDEKESFVLSSLPFLPFVSFSSSSSFPSSFPVSTLMTKCLVKKRNKGSWAGIVASMPRYYTDENGVARHTHKSETGTMVFFRIDIDCCS